MGGTGKFYTEKIIVKFLQGENPVSMLKVNDQGVVEKALPKGDYTVEIMSTDSEISYDASVKKSIHLNTIVLEARFGLVLNWAFVAQGGRRSPVIV